MARKKLQGQVAIVTGAGRGIGAATAEALAAAGARVVLTARGEDEIAAVLRRIHAQGGAGIAVPADVSDTEQVEEVVEAALGAYDRVDILINNAGVVWPFDLVVEADLDEWAYNIHVNLVGPFYLTRNVLPLMLDQRYGRIVNLTSGAAARPIPGASAYGAAKAGLNQFTRTLALELQGTGVQVNALLPGEVDTDMQADIRSVDTADTPLDTSYFHQAYEQGRLRPAALVARAVYWIVGPWGRNAHGQFFSLDDPTWQAQIAADLGG
jgi:3-oxoacyl-[acyl-carrier protein] reductase